MQWLKKNAVALALAGLLLVQISMNRAWQDFRLPRGASPREPTERTVQPSPSSPARPTRFSLPLGPVGIASTNTIWRGALCAARRSSANSRN